MGRTMTSIILDAAPPRSRARILSLRGRLGRAHYIVYSLGAVVAAFLFMLLAGPALVQLGQLGRLLYVALSVLLFYGFLPIFFTILTIKRAHDFKVGGWLALLLLVPVVNLLFWFVPGTRDENTYGAAPQGPSSGIKLIAVTLPVFLIAAFLATGDSRTSQETSPSPAAQPSTSLKPYKP